GRRRSEARLAKATEGLGDGLFQDPDLIVSQGPAQTRGSGEVLERRPGAPETDADLDVALPGFLGGDDAEARGLRQSLGKLRDRQRLAPRKADGLERPELGLVGLPRGALLLGLS